MYRIFLIGVVLLLGPVASLRSETTLPVGSAPEALEFPHFPDRMHAFIWRNWPVAEPVKLAEVLGTSVDNVLDVADSMGLPAHQPVSPEQKIRGYITVLRRNWHLLPYDQLLTLLDMSAEQLAHSLSEDDFLFGKLGGLKPQCPPLKYTPPSDESKKRAAEIKSIIQEIFGEELHRPGKPRFSFVQELGKPSGTPAKKVEKNKERFALRLIYSYFALYGDPLMHPERDPFPDGLLQHLSDLGVNGLWMHTVLRDLAPSEIFPEYGKGHATRLANLSKLVQRAKRYGIGIYLYCNEPRAMPAAFFENKEHLKGVKEGAGFGLGDRYALCTSAPEVRRWITDSFIHIFENVPDLAGVFTITASENLTNCASRGQWKECPRCKHREPAEIIAEVNEAIEVGVHRAAPNAQVICWDWGWRDEWAPEIIAKLPASVLFMSVSEWSLPITRGQVSSLVGEYSISAVGPGPRATKHWALAKQRGLKTVAKVQINNTWELSAIPYLPVMDLIAEHCSNLASAGVDGMMLSWTLGGYPSPNLKIAQLFSQDPPPTRDQALDVVAQAAFGPDGAPHARKAWTAFSNAFVEFPFHISVLYQAPQQLGPSNLLYAQPTNYVSSGFGYAYDDINSWRGPYSAEVLADQFAKVAAGWKDGLVELERAVEKSPPDKVEDARAELRFATAAQLHFATVANQTRFTLARNALLNKNSSLTADQRKNRIDEIERIIQDEINIARQLFILARDDSRIGYEAANQYFYLPIDLVEKVVNCRYILAHELRKLVPIQKSE